MEWEKILATYGLPTVMVIYFMWRDYKRDQRRDEKEDAVSKQFSDLNAQQFLLTKSCVEAVTTSNELKRELKHIMERVYADELRQERRATGGFKTLPAGEE